MGIAFLILSGVAWICSVIVSGRLRDNRELEDSSRSMLLGIFDLIVGACFYFVFSEIAKDKYMPRSEKLFVKLLTLEGIVYMITGGIQLVSGFIASAIQQEVEKKVEDRLIQNDSDTPSVKKDTWRCMCGYTNDGNRNSCPKCGRAKKEGLKGEKKWMCQCGALNPYSRNSCELCGKRIPETDRQPVPEERPFVGQGHTIENDVWICRKCSKRNLLTRPTCWFCDCPRD